MAVYDLEEQEQIAALRSWWKQYGGWATGLVLAIAMGWLGWYGWQTYLKTQNAEASRVFLVLQQASAQQNTSQVKQAAGELVNQYPRSQFASLGALLAATTLEEQPDSKFTLVYGNRRMASVMFNEALQDLKDRFADRFTMIHILSRQAQEVDLLQGRIDADKVRALVATLLPARSMDEVFVCGPEAMITATETALVEAGVPQNRVYTERFTSGPDVAAKVQADSDARVAQANQGKPIRMTVLLDGKRHELMLSADESVLDAALNAGLDIPYSCKGGVCSTCRCKVTQGTVAMDKNFTLDVPDVAQGLALSCQAHATSKELSVSFDER